jgi:hypothetical protein
MLHNIHTLNPMCSAKMEKIRLRRAIGLPTVAQNTGSSGRQSWIQWPVAGGPLVGACWIGGVLVAVMQSKLRTRCYRSARAPLRRGNVEIATRFSRLSESLHASD